MFTLVGDPSLQGCTKCQFMLQTTAVQPVNVSRFFWLTQDAIFCLYRELPNTNCGFMGVFYFFCSLCTTSLNTGLKCLVFQRQQTQLKLKLHSPLLSKAVTTPDRNSNMTHNSVNKFSAFFLYLHIFSSTGQTEMHPKMLDAFPMFQCDCAT